MSQRVAKVTDQLRCLNLQVVMAIAQDKRDLKASSNASCSSHSRTKWKPSDGDCADDFFPRTTTNTKLDSGYHNAHRHGTPGTVRAAEAQQKFCGGEQRRQGDDEFIIECCRCCTLRQFACQTIRPTLERANTRHPKVWVQAASVHKACKQVKAID